MFNTVSNVHLNRLPLAF